MHTNNDVSRPTDWEQHSMDWKYQVFLRSVLLRDNPTNCSNRLFPSSIFEKRRFVYQRVLICFSFLVRIDVRLRKKKRFFFFFFVLFLIDRNTSCWPHDQCHWRQSIEWTISTIFFSFVVVCFEMKIIGVSDTSSKLVFWEKEKEKRILVLLKNEEIHGNSLFVFFWEGE